MALYLENMFGGILEILSLDFKSAHFEQYHHNNVHDQHPNQYVYSICTVTILIINARIFIVIIIVKITIMITIVIHMMMMMMIFPSTHRVT